jgi:peptidoglycan-N-acetylglucosamine deacetylase
MTAMSVAGAAAIGAVGVGAAWAGVYYASFAVRSQLLGPTDWRGRADGQAVALTFDDGPSPDTLAVLDALDRCGARATFFMLGERVEHRPDIARAVAAAGHDVGNHSYSHPIYLYRTARETRRQLERTQTAIAEALGAAPRIARPPCGVRTRAYFAAARALGLRTIMWDTAGFDWLRRPAERIAADVVRTAVPGSIVLLHDGDSADRSDRRATAAAIALIVDGLGERGLRVAPLADLLDLDREPISTRSATAR